MRNSLELNDLLQDGFTRKLAASFLAKLNSEIGNPLFDPDYVRWAHAHGFSAEFASVLHLNESNFENYLSEYNFNKLWPFNNWSRIWVNDKLTLRYTLSDSRFVRYLPKYYYYTGTNGLRVLADNPNPDPSESAFLQVLRQVREFACKPSNASCAAGFFKLQYKDERYYMNETALGAAAITECLRNHPNYVFTEYLHPSKSWEAYSPLIHTIRIMVLNEHGNDPRIIGNYIRVPYDDVGAANYILHDGTNNDKYNLYVSIDMDTGLYGNGAAVYMNGTAPMTHHPDTGAALSGKLACFEELRQVSLDISRWYNNLTFIGFDFGITDQGIKLMEINTLPAVMVSQIHDPLYLDPFCKRYFEERLHEIDMLSDAGKHIRNEILR